MMKDIAGAGLVLGATMRLSRLVVSDDLGQWWFRDPARRWANMKESSLTETFAGMEMQAKVLTEAAVDPDNGWRSKLVSGLECPFCVGFHLGWLVLLSYVLFGRTPVWRFVATALTLNEVAAHAGARLGDVNMDHE